METGTEHIRLLSTTSTTTHFRYGRYTEENIEFLLLNDGKILSAIRHNMNYYKLAESGFLVHMYECSNA